MTHVTTKNAPIPSLGYGASEENKRKYKKPRSLAKVSEHFSHFFVTTFVSSHARQR